MSQNWFSPYSFPEEILHAVLISLLYVASPVHFIPYNVLSLISMLLLSHM